MQSWKRKNFILVAKITSRCVRIVIEGPNEYHLNSRQLEDVDTLFRRQLGELAIIFPATIYDIILTRVYDRKELAQNYPEFSGWEQVEVRMIQ